MTTSRVLRPVGLGLLGLTGLALAGCNQSPTGERVGRMNADSPPGEATPRRVSRSIGFVPAVPLGLGGGVRRAR
jgi:hypothetical protein